MFRIIKMDGSELAVVAEALWVKIGASGSLAPARNRGEAVGIAYQSIAYNLLGFDKIPDAETVMVADIDSGDYIRSFVQELAAVEDAMCEADTANAEWQAAIEDALCEIDAESEG